MKMKIIALIAVGFSCVGQERPLVVTAGKLFDGTGAVRHNSAIVVSDGRIQAVGPKGQVRAPEGAEYVDAAGKFVMPGLIDMHFHFNVRQDPRVSPWLP